MTVKILRDLPSEKRFSMEKYADKLIKYIKLIANGVEIDEVVSESVRVQKFDNGTLKKLLFKIINYYTRFIDYPGILKKQDADVFHIIDHGYSHLACSLKKMEQSPKIVITCHDLIPLKDDKKEFGARTISEIALAVFKYSIKNLKKADKIIANSETTKKDIVKYLQIDENKIKVIYLGVDEIFRKIEDRDLLASFKNKYKIPANKKILHIGVNYAYKNIERILKSLYILNKTMKLNVSFIKVGADFTETQKKLIRELDLTDKIVYLGMLPDEEMPLVYNICDTLVYPSLYEGFCLPVVEAFACSLPVVSSKSGSIPEVAGDSAIMVNSFDELELADAIKKALTDGNIRESLKNKGLERAKLFSWEKTAEQTLEVYTGCNG